MRALPFISIFRKARQSAGLAWGHWRVLFCLVVGFWANAYSPLLAQQPAYFFLGQEQFEGVEIYDMIQDQQSNYWFATDEGIFRHDGYDFERVYCEEMIGNSVFGFVMNARGALFCFNLNNQILKIEQGKASIFYTLQPDEQASDINLAVTVEDQLLVFARRVLILDAQGQVLQRSPRQNSYVGQPFRTAAGDYIAHLGSQDSLMRISHGQIQKVKLHTDGDAMDGVLRFFSLGGRSYAINVGTKHLRSFSETDYSLTSITTSTGLPQDEHLRFYEVDGRLWVASLIAGVRVLSALEPPALGAPWFQNHFISDVFQDQEGNILLSTFHHGVLVIPDLAVPDALPIPDGETAVGLRQDSTFGMLLGTTTGRLLAMRDGTTRVLSDVGTRPLSTILGWPGHPWILFDDGRIRALNRASGAVVELGIGSLKDALPNADGSYLLALNTGLCEVQRDAHGQYVQHHFPDLRQRCYALAQDGDSIYVATAEGLKVLQRGGTAAFLLDEGRRIYANDITVHRGRLYIALKNRGILVLQAGKCIFRYDPVVAGTPVQFARLQIVGDRLYAATNMGMWVQALDGSEPFRITKSNGLGTNKIHDFALLRDQIWIAHAKGLQQMRLTNLQQAIPAPSLKLASVHVNDEPQASVDGEGAFTHDQRKYRFELNSPTLRHREHIQYHYRLQGYEQTWSVAPYAEHQITYNALGPGKYTFVAMAENQGKFGEPISYSFRILSPLYARWWFITAAALLAMAITVATYRYQLRQQRKKADLQNAVNLSRLTAIQSQMNPHFIFNALNSIQDLVLRGDIDNSYSFITKFANLVRRTLKYSDKDFVSFEEEVELLQLYLSLEQLRFRGDFTYTLDTGDIEDIQVPPMLIQPFIENALVHGLIHQTGPKRLRVTFELGASLQCTIEDNGVGREKAREIKARQRGAAESFASGAIQKRFDILNAHFEGKFGFEYEDLMENGQPCGTRVRLNIPMRQMF